ncbi:MULTISPECIES: hypothetical protein [Micromonospora]|uniref:Uncharacterized protein n=1 Tax=Micromonospora solifontis TaxID=2487138 RepID=A0ABX9WCW1_9ACTN|nr:MULTISPECIES: hypothetical protein [Micromonospora]NES12728.1 hypothetical protein [Micromonospora sp. PPF5-17B]NES38443.1 hypothetical protein [Micromonospora solifontis]NES54386.1 hypothetical protein [Micromonospora sp. PPF5-6]RNL95802.1 hypothetical protein EFE23_20165 [Micromonospora solifontis]
MRALDRLTAAVVALAFVLAGLGAPGRGETLEPGAVVIAAHRSIVHDGPSALPPDGRSLRRLQLGASAPRPGVVDASATTPERPAPPSVDPRAAGARLTHPGAPSELWTEFSGGPGGDHRAGVATSDGPDDLLLAVPLRVVGTPRSVVAPTRYREPAVSLPTRGSRPSRAPPARA